MYARDATRASRHSRFDIGSWVVPVALFLPLVLLLFVAGMTWRSEQRAAAVTDRVIHDYAGIAVWQYARRTNVAFHDEVMRAFVTPRPHGANHRPPSSPADPIAELATPCPSCSSTFRRNALF